MWKLSWQALKLLGLSCLYNLFPTPGKESNSIRGNRGNYKNWSSYFCIFQYYISWRADGEGIEAEDISASERFSKMLKSLVYEVWMFGDSDLELLCSRNICICTIPSIFNCEWLQKLIYGWLHYWAHALSICVYQCLKIACVS